VAGGGRAARHFSAPRSPPAPGRRLARPRSQLRAIAFAFVVSISAERSMAPTKIEHQGTTPSSPPSRMPAISRHSRTRFVETGPGVSCTPSSARAWKTHDGSLFILKPFLIYTALARSWGPLQRPVGLPAGGAL
jgi:hypothetical protein